MKKYNLLNTLLGWVAFLIAAVTYILTLEPTASFWDCGEYIASGYKLEVGHPPGNPIFMLTARFFANFTTDPTQVAYCINLMSALLSAGTILFLFWTITHLAKKLIAPAGKELTISRTIAIMACGMVGALAYAWSDTFWFSAVEAEVYAYSSFCTALVFWLILKWESVADEPHSDRYLILIAFIMGASIAVHLLNLLCIPAIVLVFYYRKFKHVSAKGSLVALLISFVIIAILLYGIVPGFVKVAGWFELLCINTLGMPYNTGVIIYFILTMGVVAWAIFETFRQKNMTRTRILFLASILLSGIPFIGNSTFLSVVLIGILFVVLFFTRYVSLRIMNTILASLLVILIGYSSYALILIRSTANTPMDQNSPDDIFTLASYLNREQYGETPLLYGETYASYYIGSGMNAIEREETKTYKKAIKTSPDEPDRYVKITSDGKYNYPDEAKMLFPRMHSSRSEHFAHYQQWTGGNLNPKVMPSMGDNLKFFFDYQLNHMYWRYFMWNFAGRQNDLQGHGEIDKGNWITGFNFLDKHRVGDSSLLPDDMANNPGRNVFYMMPLILGLIGLLYQAFAGKEGIQQFWVIFFLFFMTGIAIVIYLNQTPLQPRERDYAYAGSFYAFTIWIGLGVAAIYRGMERLGDKLKIKNSIIPAAITTIICMCVPLQMVSQTWDDHDRSGRYFARDFGMNYLSSLEPNAIIFTNGDNDTFPLWYAQEVEGFRTDVRVCNLSYLQTDWYADQMKRPAYESEAVPMMMTRDVYGHNALDICYVNTYTGKPTLSVEQAFTDMMQTMKKESVPIIASNNLYFPVDVESAIHNAGLPAGYERHVVNRITPGLQNSAGFLFYELAMLDIINSSIQNDWERPIYFAVTVGNSMYMGLENYFALTGLAYHLVPMDVNACGGVDTERMYDNVMNKFRWGGLDKCTPEDPIYLDENSRRMCLTMRVMVCNLTRQLIYENKPQKALDVLNLIDEKIPMWLVPYDRLGMEMAYLYHTLGENEKALNHLFSSCETSIQYLRWYNSLEKDILATINAEDMNGHVYTLKSALNFLDTAGMNNEAEKLYQMIKAAGLE